MRGATFIVAGVAVLVLAGTGVGAAGEAPQGSPSSLTLEDARAFDDRTLYFAGDRVEGLPLVAVLRRDDTADFVSFVYGDCTPVGDSGCAPPVEIQVWPACRRSLALHDSSSPSLQYERTTVRGAPAAVLDGGTRLELQTGRSTVVVFADSRARLARIAGALRSLDGSSTSGGALPPPAAGELRGEPAC